MHPIINTEQIMVETYFNALLQEIDRYTATVSLEGENIIPGCREMMMYLKDKMIELKNHVLSHGFGDETEEIRFFKHQKPLVLGRLLYYYKLYQIESNRPPSYELGLSYYQCEIEKLKAVFERNLSFFQYCRSGATYRDGYYFKRGQTEISPEADTFLFEPETEFSTGYDRLVARMIAVELLLAFLTKRLHEPADGEPLSGKKLYWTDKKAAAVELIYGICASGSVDNGKADIIDIVTAFERTFHIDLGDVYHTFIAMRNRKNSRTVYLDQMIEKLLKRMDETDS